MFDITKLYNRIIRKLEKHNKNVTVSNLKDCTSAGCTGSEILSMTGKYLKDLKVSDSESYKIIRFEIACYLFYCRMQGLLIK